MKNTKIVATVSDKRCDVEFVRELARAGVNVVRMNTAHLDEAGMTKIVNNVREADPHLALLVDTKGPEIRTTVTKEGKDIEFHAGDCLEIVGDPDGATSNERICVNYPHIASDLNVGDRLLIDDGELAFTVTGKNGSLLTARAENDGELGSRKSVNVPGVSIALPSVTERDHNNIIIADRLGVDFVAHSFVRSAKDVSKVQAILDTIGSEMKIISKIENQEGIDNFDSILEASYGIMIARGDLGIEVPAEMIPGMQLNMINKCIAAHKPVIVATQMLHTMIEHPRPTRAEVSDVANAVFQGADAVMLSGETAYGKYPVEAVKTMARVAEEVVSEISRQPWHSEVEATDVPSFLARQAVRSEKIVGAEVVITYAYNGVTARYLASFRGSKPVLAVCYNEKVAHWLALSYGIIPRVEPSDTEDSDRRAPVHAMKEMIADGLVRPDQLVAYISGTRSGASSLQIAPVSQFFD